MFLRFHSNEWPGSVVIMTGPPADPAADLVAVDQATARLLATLDTLDATAVAAPSQLPGWTRGHVLTHVARNADALVNVLTGRPMYHSEAAREADIERGAGRPLATQRDDVRDSAARLAETAVRLTPEQWQTTVTMRHGVTARAARIPFHRWLEVELHHVDLGAGRTVDDLPGAFVDRAMEYLAWRFDDRTDVPAVELRAEDGRTWRTGRRGDPPVVVAGAPAALVGWLSGRTAGSGLSTSGGTLPGLPPL